MRWAYIATAGPFSTNSSGRNAINLSEHFNTRDGPSTPPPTTHTHMCDFASCCNSSLPDLVYLKKLRDQHPGTYKRTAEGHRKKFGPLPVRPMLYFLS